MFTVYDLVNLEKRAVLNNSDREDFFNTIKDKYEATLELCKDKLERLDNLKNVVELKGLSSYVKFEGNVLANELGLLGMRLDKKYLTNFNLEKFMNEDRLEEEIEVRGRKVVKKIITYKINDILKFDKMIDTQLDERERKIRYLVKKIEVSKNLKVVKIDGSYYNNSFDRADYYKLSNLINELCNIVNKSDKVYNVDEDGIFYNSDVTVGIPKIYIDDIEITALKNGKAVITFK